MSVLGGHRVVPVCGLRSPQEAERLAQALLDGGLPLIEVTLRTPDALDSLRAMAAVPGLTVGAGTVRTAEQLDAVQAAGAQFAVSPCLTRGLVRAARSSDLPLVPGVATASEIQRAIDDGFGLLKFFPAEASGGLPALRSLAEVFPEARFMPTGGISAASAPAYLAHPQIEAVGGSWMLPLSAREAGDWDLVTRTVAACAGADGAC